MIKHTKGAREGLDYGCQTSHIPFWHSNCLDKVVIINRGKGRTLPTPNTGLALRVPSLPLLWLAFFTTTVVSILMESDKRLKNSIQKNPYNAATIDVIFH